VSVRHAIIGLNILAVIAIVVFLCWAVLSPKRAPEDEKPANLTPFFPDEDLESRRLERVQGWALVFAVVVAVALPLYWLHEPSRQKESHNYFKDAQVERGQILFSNSSMPTYNPTQSLQCANCHGANGQGGQAPTQLDGKAVAWQAPPLNTVLQRFEEDPECSDPPDQQPDGTVCNVTSIITYGRPGTPMQAWGVAGGGPKNAQSIQDLVAFLRTIQLKPNVIRAQEAANLKVARSTSAKAVCPQYMTCPGIQEAVARQTLKTASAALDVARTALQKALNTPNATDPQLIASCDAITAQVKADPAKVDRKQAAACGAFLTARTAKKTAQAAYVWSVEWSRRRANVSDGQLLFEANCARCHTAGWSTFNSAVPPDAAGGLDGVGLPGGGGGNGGGIGFNLRSNDTIRRFGDDASGGFDAQMTFVGAGSVPNKGYGDIGIGSGRMPGFTNMLTQNQLGQIVTYERYCLDASTFLAAQPMCKTSPPGPRTAPTTTTTAKAAG
jgi:mono/diheme cytochrome c family protein